MSDDSKKQFDELFKEMDAQDEDVLAEIERQELLAQDKANRPVYKTFGQFFVLAAVVILSIAIAEQIFNFQFFSGRVYGISLFLLLIGVLLWRG